MSIHIPDKGVRQSHFRFALQRGKYVRIIDDNSKRMKSAGIDHTRYLYRTLAINLFSLSGNKCETNIIPRYDSYSALQDRPP